MTFNSADEGTALWSPAEGVQAAEREREREKDSEYCSCGWHHSLVPLNSLIMLEDQPEAKGSLVNIHPGW